jgi:hypothetical protein
LDFGLRRRKGRNPTGREGDFRFFDFGFWIWDCDAEKAETRPVGRVTFDFSILDLGFWICHAEKAETRPVGRETFDFGFWIWDCDAEKAETRLVGRETFDFSILDFGFGIATPKMQKPDR